MYQIRELDFPHGHALAVGVGQRGQTHVFIAANVGAAHVAGGNVHNRANRLNAVGAALRGGELLDVLREERGIEQTLVDQALDEAHALAPALLGEREAHGAVMIGVY